MFTSIPHYSVLSISILNLLECDVVLYMIFYMCQSLFQWGGGVVGGGAAQSKINPRILFLVFFDIFLSTILHHCLLHFEMGKNKSSIPTLEAEM